MKPRTVAEERASIHQDLDRWYGEEYDRLKEMLDDLLKAHAHELAEKQRAEVRTRASDVFHCGSAAWAIRGVDEMADLIDPEVSKPAKPVAPAKRKPYSQRWAEIAADTTPCVCEHGRNKHSINGINCRECLCTGFRPEAASADG